MHSSVRTKKFYFGRVKDSALIFGNAYFGRLATNMHLSLLAALQLHLGTVPGVPFVLPNIHRSIYSWQKIADSGTQSTIVVLPVFSQTMWQLESGTGMLFVVR